MTRLPFLDRADPGRWDTFTYIVVAICMACAFCFVLGLFVAALILGGLLMEAASYTSAYIHDITAKVRAALRENSQVEVHFTADAHGLYTVLFIDRRG